METIVLTPHQQAAIVGLVDRLTAGEPLVALRGLAGTGKTTLIPALRQALESAGRKTLVGAPTNRAAMVLRSKGIADAETIHSIALIPYFHVDYGRAMAWLGEPMPTLPGDCNLPVPDVEGLPWLVWQEVQPDLEKAHRLYREHTRPHGRRYRPRRLLSSLGIHGDAYYTGFGPKTGDGVLIIDEASMVGQELLTICQQAFDQICLIGDPGQLPPVKDKPILQTIPGEELTELHRQAQDSGIVQLAYRARRGEPFWRERIDNGHDIHLTHSLLAESLLETPLIVWRNATRVACSKAIRAALGYPTERLVVGEPLVCRSTAKEDRVLGFYNNGMYRIVWVDADDPRYVEVEDPQGYVDKIHVHIEELDGPRIPPRAIPFRLGYCITAHTAQGGEWPIVHISLPELQLYAGWCRKHDKPDTLHQWIYTAITRAKQHVCFLGKHTFLAESNLMATIKPPSSPMLGMTPDPLSDPATPEIAVKTDQQSLEDLSDIPEPAVPAQLQAALTDGTPSTLPTNFGVHEALLHGFCQHLMGRLDPVVGQHLKMADQALQAMYDNLRRSTEALFQHNEHAQYQLSDALLKLQEHGLALRHDPYEVQIHVMSPQGFPLDIKIAKASQEALTDELMPLLVTLAERGYKPVL